MNGAINATNDTNHNIEEDEQLNGHVERPREEVVAELILIINNLFDFNNIVHNSYLIKRAKNEKFEVPIQVIYNENNIRNVSDDKDIVNEALEKSENIIVNKKDNNIHSVSLRNNELRRKITVQNIPREKRDAFKQFVISLNDAKEDTYNWNFNKLNFANILCKDEETASNLYKLISTSKFEEEPLDCSLNSDNIYISGLENLKRKNRNYANPQTQMDFVNYMNPINAMNPRNQMFYNNMMGFNPYMQGYPMNAYYNGASNNYYVTNHYRNMNNYHQNTSPQNYVKPAQQTQNTNYNKKPYTYNSSNNNNNQNYNNDKRAYAKKNNKQPRDKNYKYNNKGGARSNVVVNDNDFPPL
jgi:hypothetical protein